MRSLRRAAAVLAAALCLAHTAAAQDVPTISLTPSDPPRWDLAAHLAWFGANHSDVGPDWDRWYSAAAGGVTLGHYSTPHLKTEIQGTVSRAGRIFSQELIPAPGQPFPAFLSREHVFQAATLHAGVAYQFFENQWFHPFVGAGLELSRERHRVDVPQQIVPSRDPTTPQFTPGSRGTDDVSYAAHPFVDAGFKWFVSDHAFLRGELATSISSRGFKQTAWSTGIGAEF